MKLEEYIETEEFDDDFDEEYEEEFDEEYDDEEAEYLEETSEADEEEYRDKTNINVLKFLDFCSIWFIRIGLLLSIGLFVTFIVNGKVKTAFLYVLGLIISFFFGYIFMYLLDFVFSRERNKDTVEID